MTLTLEQAAGMLREAMLRDKSWEQTTLSMEVRDYLRSKRRRLTPASYDDYESTLGKLCWHMHGLSLADLEPPVGSQRIEDFLDHHWGKAKPKTYNKHLTILRDFFKHAQIREFMRGNPTLTIQKAKVRAVYRTTFTLEQRRAIMASSPELRDKLALRLWLEYGIRKGSLQACRFQHFDASRRKLTIFAKGGKIQIVPIPDPAFWLDLERLMLETEARPTHHLIPRMKGNQNRVWPLPEEPRSSSGLHRWWYHCLERAGIVDLGVTSGEKIHKARHTAGQRLLDVEGNLKAVQKLLGHESITTTADTYVDWSEEQLAASLTAALEREMEQ